MTDLVVAVGVAHRARIECVDTFLPEIGVLVELLHVRAVDSRVTQESADSLQVGDHEVLLAHLVSEMAEGGHDGALAELEVVGVLYPPLCIYEGLGVEEFGTFEALVELEDGWGKEVDRPDVQVAGHLPEVLGHLVGIDLADEPAHAGLFV